eukprot:g3135.t1
MGIRKHGCDGVKNVEKNTKKGRIHGKRTFFSLMLMRKLTHVGPALATLYLHEYHFDRYNDVVALCTGLFFVLLFTDDLRRRNASIHSQYSKLMYMKPYENKCIGASVYYFIGVLINLYFGLLAERYRVFCVVGILCLGLGDPAAWICGYTFPIRKLYGSKKSLGGFIGCLGVSFIFSYLILTSWSTKKYASDGVYFFCSDVNVLSLLSAIVAASTELFIEHDNLFIPLVGMAKKKKTKKGDKEKKAKKEKKNDSKKVSVEEERRQQLLVLAKSMKARINTEVEHFDRFQQQRDQLNHFWLVERKNLEDKKSERRHKDRQEQDLREKHEVDIKLYKQSVKHLLNEHQSETTDLKTNFEVSLKLKEDEQRNRLAVHKKDLREIKNALKESEMTQHDFLTSVKHRHDENIASLREKFELMSKDLREKYDMKLKLIRTKLDKARKNDTQRIEDKKNAHIARLMKKNGRAFEEIKSYYHDITHTNLDKIKGLKEEVALLKSKAINHKKKMEKITNENKKMVKPLEIAKSEVSNMREQLKHYNKDKDLLDSFKKQILDKEERLQKIRWKIEVRGLEFEGLKRERDSLHNKFQSAIHEVKQKGSFKNLLIEKKLGAMNTQLEKAEAHVGEVLSQANIEDVASAGVDVVDRKNQEIRELQDHLEKIVVRHNEIVEHYESKLLDHGVPVEELGFMPSAIKMTDVCA